jgi:hypothetical protein
MSSETSTPNLILTRGLFGWEQQLLHAAKPAAA